MEPFFPPSANYSTIFLLFGISLAVFHVLFLFVVPLSKTGWKAVDYVWLAAAGISLIAATAEVRKTTATAYQELATSHVQKDWDAIRSFAAQYGTGSTLCVPRTKAPSLPTNFDAIVKEREASCAWFKQVKDFLDARRPTGILTGDQLPKRPTYTLTDLKKIEAEFNELGTQYNKSFLMLYSLQLGAQRTPREESLLVLAPYLLAIALALRFTKVTGEIRIDSGSATPAQLPAEPVAAAAPAPEQTPVEPIDAAPVAPPQNAEPQA